MEHGESPESAALREATEELGRLPGGLRHHHTFTDDHGGWAYHTVVMDSPSQFDLPRNRTWESGGHGWFTPGQMHELPLHPGFRSSWDRLRSSGALRAAKGGMVIAAGVDDQVALPARAPVIAIGPWAPETAEEVEQMIRAFPGLLRALHAGLRDLAGRMDELPVTEEIPDIIRRMAEACLRAAEDADGLLPPAGEDPPEGTWQGPRAIEPPKG